jgi:adenine-specific DNA methylase
MRYTSAHHSARYTEDFVFSQLIPYIGNKRKLLPLIARAIAATSLTPAQATFLDAFSGSTVVSRFAKQLGFAVTANDWEPYAHALAQCFIQLNEAPTFFHSRTYTDVLSELNSLPPEEGWITHHLCPANDAAPDTSRDRMFYMRKNGMRLDAIRNRIAAWSTAGDLSDLQAAALLGPLLYQASWLANTSGVFKGFHNGWGGQTGTALYRIQADLHLEPAVFHNNHRDNTATRFDASSITEPHDIAYLDPPYNQHPSRPPSPAAVTSPPSAATGEPPAAAPTTTAPTHPPSTPACSPSSTPATCSPATAPTASSPSAQCSKPTTTAATPPSSSSPTSATASAPSAPPHAPTTSSSSCSPTPTTPPPAPSTKASTKPSPKS